MKILNGTDIIEINRIKETIEKNGEKFLNKIYTKQEIDYCEAKKNQKYQSYAARFAAKEAAYKALSEYINFKYSWKDFEIENNSKGKPIIKIHFNVYNLKELEISISHCKEYAVANVVALFEEN